jgi:hypothetical protein
MTFHERRKKPTFCLCNVSKSIIRTQMVSFQRVHAAAYCNIRTQNREHHCLQHENIFIFIVLLRAAAISQYTVTYISINICTALTAERDVNYYNIVVTFIIIIII